MSFAFNYAKGRAAEAGTDVSGLRANVEADPLFKAHLDTARRTVAEMAVQFICLDDPIGRTLSEVYDALALGIEEFNSFETH